MCVSAAVPGDTMSSCSFPWHLKIGKDLWVEGAFFCPPPTTAASSGVKKLNKAMGAEGLCTVSGKNVLNISLTPHRSFKIYTAWISST